MLLGLKDICECHFKSCQCLDITLRIFTYLLRIIVTHTEYTDIMLDNWLEIITKKIHRILLPHDFAVSVVHHKRFQTVNQRYYKSIRT